MVIDPTKPPPSIRVGIKKGDVHTYPLSRWCRSRTRHSRTRRSRHHGLVPARARCRAWQARRIRFVCISIFERFSNRTPSNGLLPSEKKRNRMDFCRLRPRSGSARHAHPHKQRPHTAPAAERMIPDPLGTLRTHTHTRRRRETDPRLPRFAVSAPTATTAALTHRHTLTGSNHQSFFVVAILCTA